MSDLEPSMRKKRLHKMLPLLASFVALFAVVGPLSFAVHEPLKPEATRPKSGPPAPHPTAMNARTVSSPLPRADKPSSSSSSSSSSSNSSTFRISDDSEPVPAIPHSDKKLALIELDDVPLHEAMRLFSEQTGMNVITSTDAGAVKVTVYLKNVTAIAALEAIVKANGLFYRIEPDSGIVRIATMKEYERDLSSFREEQTKVFTLLYPNPTSVAQVIQQVFGNRVKLSRADGEIDDLIDLSQRFNRFDLVDGRSLGLGNQQNRANNQLGQFGRNLNMQLNPFGMGGMGGLGMGGLGMGGLAGLGMAGGQGVLQSQQLNPPTPPKPLSEMSPDQIQQLENLLFQEGRLEDELKAEVTQQREATIYVSTIRRNNQVIVRTADTQSMDQIAKLITQLDVPTPTVLLEVKVLRVLLADGFQSTFEFLGGQSKPAVSFSDGSLAPSFPGGSSIAQALGDGLGVAGNVPGSLTFQLVDDTFRFRMQLLESKNCVTALATPLILTANNEVSRIFVGDTLPFTIGFTPSQVIGSVGAVGGAVAATPITELRDVGQSLLITPNINADRTVTLRVVEENSERVIGGSSIPVPASTGTGVTNIPVDTVRRRTISGTVVAQDGMAVALAGMIEEHDSEKLDRVPVLGSVPGLGFLFRRQANKQVRSELVVLIRPYIFNTPAESAATTETLLSELGTQPTQNRLKGCLGLQLPCAVTRTDAECYQRAKLFQFLNHADGMPQ